MPLKMLPEAAGRDADGLRRRARVRARSPGLHVSSGRFFDAADGDAGAVAVLGQAAAASMFGTDDPGRAAREGEPAVVPRDRRRRAAAGGADRHGRPAGAGPQQRDLRAADGGHAARRGLAELPEGRDRRHLPRARDRSATSPWPARSCAACSTRRTGARATSACSCPAELLAEQQRTRRIFQVVMVAIASISLLVGGIGIMNIMLASVLERTREIGVRRAVGARRVDIIRQFLIETTLITTTGGVLGIVLGVVLSQLVGYFAGWSTIVTMVSIAAGVLRVRLGRAHLRRLPGHARVEPRPGLRAALRVARRIAVARVSRGSSDPRPAVRSARSHWLQSRSEPPPPGAHVRASRPDPADGLHYQMTARVPNRRVGTRRLASRSIE